MLLKEIWYAKENVKSFLSKLRVIESLRNFLLLRECFSLPSDFILIMQSSIEKILLYI